MPQGWYPRNPQEVADFLVEFEGIKPVSRAAIAPHAGWYYSGKIAAAAVASLDCEAETIVVLGGHLPAGSPFLFAMEDAVKTPFDPMPIDAEFRSILIEKLSNSAEDRYRDNTIEVQLPMVRYFFPISSLIWLRLPADSSSFEAGKVIAKTAAKLNRKVNVLASTDLTHYGANYGFAPKGSGAAALRWLREVNDANFIKAVESGDSEQVLLRAKKDQSSCSAGAVVGAMGFAETQGLPRARLLQYATSADIDSSSIPDSFVGYACFNFS